MSHELYSRRNSKELRYSKYRTVFHLKYILTFSWQSKVMTFRDDGFKDRSRKNYTFFPDDNNNSSETTMLLIFDSLGLLGDLVLCRNNITEKKN